MPIAQLTTNNSSGWAVAAPAVGREVNGTAAASTAAPQSQVRSQPETASKEVVARLQEALNRPGASAQFSSRQLKINVDDGSGKVVVSVYDAQTDKLIRQFPPDEVLHVAEIITNILKQDKGSLLNEKT